MSDKTNLNHYSVYVHIVPNGKLYFGATGMKPKYRWNSGFSYKGCRLFDEAIKEYGWCNIQHIVLIDGLTKEMAYECEKALIQKYHSNDPEFGYNLAGGGAGTSGYKFNDEQRKAVSERLKGHATSEETRRKIGKSNSIALKGKKLPEEVKRKLSESLKGKNLGRHHTEEAKRKNALAHMGKQYHLGFKHSEETRKKISEALTGRKLSEEERIRSLECLAKARQDPIIEARRREKIRQSHLGKKKMPWSDEARAAHMAAIERRKQRRIEA